MPTIAIDFDGVIHRYSQGYKDGSLYDVPVTGVDGFIANLFEYGYSVYIHSTRDPFKIQDWMATHLAHYPTVILVSQQFWNEPNVIGISSRKIPAVAYIDDRAIRFTGNWLKVWNDLHQLSKDRRKKYAKKNG